RPYPLTSVTVIPCTPIAVRASRTSSSLKGLMMAMMIFMGSIPRLGPVLRWQAQALFAEASPRKQIHPAGNAKGRRIKPHARFGIGGEGPDSSGGFGRNRLLPAATRAGAAQIRVSAA